MVVNKVKGDVEAYETQRNLLMRKYGKASADGQSYSFIYTKEDGEKVNTVAEYQAELDTLLEAETGLDLEPTLALADLKDVAIKPIHLAALDGFVIKPE